MLCSGRDSKLLLNFQSLYYGQEKTDGLTYKQQTSYSNTKALFFSVRVHNKKKYILNSIKTLCNEVFQGRRRRGGGGGQRGLVPPHFQKWGAQVGLIPPPTFDRPSVLI